MHKTILTKFTTSKPSLAIFTLISVLLLFSYAISLQDASRVMYLENHVASNLDYVKKLETDLQRAIDEGKFAERIMKARNEEIVPIDLLEEYQNALAPFLQLPPPAELKVHRRPVSLEKTLDCSRYNIFTGRKRAVAAKVYDIITFSTELDLLEVRMHELKESVDHFVISEAEWTHRRVPKPLYFAQNRHRYKAFEKNITHLVVGYEAFGPVLRKLLPDIDENDWEFEVLHREFTKKHFESGHGPIEDDAIVIDGDVDEIPNGLFVYHLKHCEPKPYYDTLIVQNNLFYFGLKWIKRNNWEAPIVTLNNNVSRFQRGEEFKQGRVKMVIVNNPISWHISYYGHPAFIMWKSLSIAEGRIHEDTFNVTKVRNARETGKMLYNQPSHDRFFKVERAWTSDKLDKPITVPWVVYHNPKRYPFLLDGLSDESMSLYYVSS